MRPTIPNSPEVTPDIRSLISSCWSHSPERYTHSFSVSFILIIFSFRTESRPSFRVILKRLHDILVSASPSETNGLMESDFSIDSEPRHPLSIRSPLYSDATVNAEHPTHSDERKSDSFPAISQSEVSSEPMVTLETSMEFSVCFSLAFSLFFSHLYTHVLFLKQSSKEATAPLKVYCICHVKDTTWIALDDGTVQIWSFLIDK